MPGTLKAGTSSDYPWQSVARAVVCVFLFAASGNSLSQHLLPYGAGVGTGKNPSRNNLYCTGLFEEKTLSVTLGRGVIIPITDTAGEVTLESADSTVVIVRGKKVIGIKRGTSRIIARQISSGLADTLNVSVVPWIAGASSLIADQVEPDFRGMAVRGDSVFMQSYGPSRGWRDLYQYVSSTDELQFLHEFSAPYVEEEYLLPTPFGNFVIANRDSSMAARKVYRSTRLIDEAECVASIFGPDNDIETGSYVLPQGWSFDASGNVYVGEYLGNTPSLPNYQVKILKGSSFGTHWDTAYMFPPRCLRGRDGGVRHVHACQVDPYTGDIWIGTGDADDQSRIYNHTNKLLPDSDGVVRLNLVGIGNQEFRVVSFAFTQDYIYWFMDAPVYDQKIFRVRRRDSYPTLTPETPKEDDYREVVAVLPDKPLYNNTKVDIRDGSVILVSSVYEDASCYNTSYRELDTCVRVFAIREYADGLVQTQEVFSAQSLARWGECTPLGQDAQGNIFFKTLHLEAAGESAVYRTHLLWQDAQAQVVVPGPSETIQFPIVGFTIRGTVVQGGFASVVYTDAPPPSLDLPPLVSSVSPFCWDAQAYGLTLLDGKVSIDLSKVSSLGDPASLVILQESQDGERWDNLGGEIVDNELVSTDPVASIGPVAIGVMSGPLAVQLAWLKASCASSVVVTLDWETVSEIDNYGFEVQESKDPAGPFVTVPNSFVPGHGTTTQRHTYSFTFQREDPDQQWLRLKQTDLDGTLHYSESVLPEALDNVASGLVPKQFSLDQNYPNPFNPTTTIRYGIPRRSHVVLTVHNALGQKVAELVNGEIDAGYHEVGFDGRNLSSGVYFYRLQSGSFVESRKFLLLR
jgi:hypothetical protein